MRVSVLTRYCECGSIINAGVHRHAEGCPRNREQAWFRVRLVDIRVNDPGRWEVVRLFMAGILFYIGLATSVSGEIGSVSHIGGGVTMFAGIVVLLTCCRTR